MLTPEKLGGGKNPGAVLCHEMRGNVVFALDNEDNESTFCQFTDESLIDNGSLAYFAELNDEIGTKKK
jgi:hypothetical protein